MSLWTKNNPRCPLCQQDWVVARIARWFSNPVSHPQFFIISNKLQIIYLVSVFTLLFRSRCFKVDPSSPPKLHDRFRWNFEGVCISPSAFASSTFRFPVPTPNRKWAVFLKPEVKNIGTGSQSWAWWKRSKILLFKYNLHFLIFWSGEAPETFENFCPQCKSIWTYPDKNDFSAYQDWDIKKRR